MTTRQPIWKFVDNLGDASPIDYGGLFLYEDETGVYPPELEKLERVSDRDDSEFEIHRVVLDRCKEVVGEVSERAYLVPYSYDPATYRHPLPQYEEWFTESLAGVAATMDTTERALRDDLCSDDSKRRAEAYRCIYDHHGWANGDSYPLNLNLDEVEDRYTLDEVSKRDPIDRLRDALEAEHITDCGDNNTCDINKAFELDLYLWAAQLLTGATECPRTTSALSAIAPTKDQLDAQCAELVAEPHMICGECNATVWTEEPRATCSNCCAEVVCSVYDVELDKFTEAYVECALWSSTDNSREDGGDALDSNYDAENIAPECAREMLDDCAQFQYHQRELLAKAYAQPNYTEGNAGHDFWLTRNGHGAGFWDRGLGDVGDKLSKECKPYGSVDLYVDDDGKIHSN